MDYSSWQGQISLIVSQALAEDLAAGDVTTGALIPPELEGQGIITAEEEGILAGIEVAEEVFRQVDPGIRFEKLAFDGEKLSPGKLVAQVSGKAAGILQAERTALNFLQRLSGIATETQKYVQAVSGTKAKILDTRKTTPGLRLLEKYAVRVGGGQNHRRSLGDGILIKDNHLAALRSKGLGIGEVVKIARQNAPHTLKIEVEVETLEQVGEAVEAGADVIMLDNMPLDQMRQAVKLIGGRALIEASGGINLGNVRKVAETGVDFISIGALTHSIRALSFSLSLQSTAS